MQVSQRRPTLSVDALVTSSDGSAYSSSASVGACPRDPRHICLNGDVSDVCQWRGAYPSQVRFVIELKRSAQCAREPTGPVQVTATPHTPQPFPGLVQREPGRRTALQVVRPWSRCTTGIMPPAPSLKNGARRTEGLSGRGGAQPRQPRPVRYRRPHVRPDSRNAQRHERGGAPR